MWSLSKPNPIYNPEETEEERRKRDFDFQMRMLKASEKRWYERPLMLWFLSFVFISIGGFSLLQFQGCERESYKLDQELASLYKEIQERRDRAERALAISASIKEFKDYLDPKQSAILNGAYRDFDIGELEDKLEKLGQTSILNFSYPLSIEASFSIHSQYPNHSNFGVYFGRLFPETLEKYSKDEDALRDMRREWAIWNDEYAKLLGQFIYRTNSNCASPSALWSFFKTGGGKILRMAKIDPGLN